MSQFNSDSDEPLLRQAHESLAATEVPSGPSPELIQRVSDQMKVRDLRTPQGSSRWLAWRTHYATTAVVLVAAVGLAILFSGLGNRVLADVVKQLDELKSGQARMTKTVDGVQVSSMKVFFKGKSFQRTEFSSGDIDVLNLNRGEHTRLLAVEKKVVVEPAYEISNGDDPISRLKNIASQPMRKIPVRTIDGVANALGFSKQEDGNTETMWVDPKTRLPIRGETTFKDAGGKTVTLTLDELEYNVDMADSLFEISLPATYVLEDRRPAKVEGTVDLDNIELVLSPNKGLGPVTFGMSREAVVKLFGSPDSTEVRKVGVETFERLLKDPKFAGSHDSIRKDIEHLKTTEPYRIGTEFLKYSSKGFQVSLLPSKGVVGITCLAGHGAAARTFQGRTQEGVRMSDSREKIEDLYGKADRVHAGDGYCQLHYSKLGITMELTKDKLMSLAARKAND